MTRDRKSLQDAPDWVDRLLHDVSETPDAEASPEFLARVLDDAMDMLPPPGGEVERLRLWRQIVHGLGGCAAVGGLATAAVTGFAMGLNGYDATGVEALFSTGFDDVYESQMGLSAYGWDLEEG